MIDSTFETRICPSCGQRDTHQEIHSDRRGEMLSFEELRPFWSGLFKEKVFFSYDRCGKCGLLFAPIFFNADQLGELYAEMAPNMDLVPSDALAATQRSYFEVVARDTVLEGGYLEIGPDIGHIVGHAADNGRLEHFWLFEPNRAVHLHLAAATRGKPHTISAEMTDLSPVPDGSIGLAVMVHVLDHLLDPMTMLEQVRAKLRPGGTLMVVTHNEASVLRKVMGSRWPPFCLQHPQIFRPESIKKMMGGAGYRAVRVERSKNYFPISFMARQAAWTFRINLDSMPLPKVAIGLKLGNIITIAKR